MADDVDRVERVSVTEASRRGVARLVADAAHGTEVVVERHGEALAAVVAYERYTELVQLRADLRDLALVLGRGADDDGTRHTLDDVVDVTLFLVDPDVTAGPAIEALAAAFPGEPKPNATAGGVTWLSGFQFEIKVIAKLPDGPAA